MDQFLDQLRIQTPIFRVFRMVLFTVIAVVVGVGLVADFNEDRSWGTLICIPLFVVLIWLLNRRRISGWSNRWSASHHDDGIGQAVRSLPWYIVGAFLFLPLILAPFTGGATFAWYLTPAALFDKTTPLWLVSVMLFGPGLFLWTLRQFVRLAVFSFRRSHPWLELPTDRAE